MQAWWTLLRRELGGFFASLMGYVVIASGVFLMGLSFVVMLAQLQGAPMPMPLTELFFLTPFFWVIVLLAAPVITMRLFAAEKASGTYETLMTTPVRELDVVLAKFSAALIFYLVLWLPLLLCLTIVRYHTAEPAALDAGTVGATYLGILLIGATFLAMGCLASALTHSQTVAAVLGLGLGTTLFMTSFLSDYFQTLGPWTREFLAGLALVDQMRDFSRGVVDTRAVVFHLSLVFLFLFLTLRAVESRRWK